MATALPPIFGIEAVGGAEGSKSASQASSRHPSMLVVQEVELPEKPQLNAPEDLTAMGEVEAEQSTWERKQSSGVARQVVVLNPRDLRQVSLLPAGVRTWEEAGSSALDAHRLLERRSYTRESLQSEGDAENTQDGQDARCKILAKYRKHCAQLQVRPAPEVLSMLHRGRLTFDPCVNLAHCGLGDAGLVSITRMLPPRGMLRCLNLADNNLSDAGVFVLLQDLEAHFQLCSLNLSNNVKVRMASMGPLLRFLLERESVVTLGIDCTGITTEAQEVLYLQAFANRCEARRRHITLLPETPPPSLRKNVEELALKFRLCKGSVVIPPEPGRRPKDADDVWKYMQHFERAALLQKQWERQYTRLEGTLHKRATAQFKQRADEIMERWPYLSLMLMFNMVSLNKEDAAHAIGAKLPPGRSQMDQETARLGRIINFVQKRGKTRCVAFVLAMKDRQEINSKRIERLVARMKMLRSVRHVIFLVQANSRQTRRLLMEHSVQNFVPWRRKDLDEFAETLERLLYRGRRARVAAETLDYAAKRLKECIDLAETRELSSSLCKRVGKKAANATKIMDTVTETKKANAAAMQMSIFKELTNIEALEETLRASAQGPSLEYIQDIEQQLREILAVARSRGLDERMDPAVLAKGRGRLTELEIIRLRCERELNVVSAKMTTAESIFNEVVYPLDAQSGRHKIDGAMNAMESLIKVIEEATPTGMLALEGIDRVPEEEEPGEDFSALLVPALQQVRVALLEKLCVVREQLGVALNLLDQDPRSLALDNLEVKEGRPAGLLVPLNRTLMDLREAGESGLNALVVVAECRQRLGLSFTEMDCELFMQPEDERTVSEKVALDRLGRLRVEKKLASDIFALLTPFSFANLRRLLLAVPKRQHGQS